MSMNDLTNRAMIAISHDMLTAPDKLSLLERDELSKSVVDRLRGIHAELSQLTTLEGALQARLQEISEELRQCDQIHDRLARGIFRALEATADLQPTAEQGQIFLEVRNLLFPDGLSINSLSYLEQSGNVLKVAKQATPSVRAILARIVCDGPTLVDAFDTWVQNGEQMGKLVAERSGLLGEEDATRVSASDLRNVRNRWIHIMHMLLNAVDLMDISEADRRRLLSNLREAEAAASRTRAAEQRRNAQTESVEENKVEDAAGEEATVKTDEVGRAGDEPQAAVNPVAEDV